MLSQKLTLAAAGNAADPVYVDDVFSTFLYDGNNGTQSINNGIDLSGEGGMVWLKKRNSNNDHYVGDTARGAGKVLLPNDSLGQLNWNANDTFKSFDSSGFTVGSNTGFNGPSDEMCSWTFRKCPGFFDIVTYTGDGSYARNISHNLGSVPGSVWVKRLSGNDDWVVYHRETDASSPQDYVTFLNDSGARNDNDLFADTAPTASVFTVGSNVKLNGNGSTYIAYLFAHDEQTFGDRGNEAIIKCGSYTGTGSLQYINLGFEPQWVLIKNVNGGYNWLQFDTMRGWNAVNAKAFVVNNNDAESDVGLHSSLGIELRPTATGFTVSQNYDFLNKGPDSGTVNYIYMAIRRPHKPPSAGTDVFAIDTRGSTGDGNEPTYRSGFPVDMQFNRNVTYAGGDMSISSRLTQGTQVFTNLANQESSNSTMMFDYMNGVQTDTGTGSSQYAWMFKRAPGFFDVVTYTGNGANPGSFNHNLGVVPEMIWVKRRSSSDWWTVYHSSQGAGKEAAINLNSAFSSNGRWSGNTPTATEVFVQSDGQVNQNGQRYVAYLFATLAGISKVGSYNGSSSAIDVDCGFTNGARFVLIKRTDASGNWMVFDTERGIVSGDDPYIQLDTTDASNNGSDLVDPLAAGFTVNSGNGNVNTSGASYIFLAIA